MTTVLPLSQTPMPFGKAWVEPGHPRWTKRNRSPRFPRGAFAHDSSNRALVDIKGLPLDQVPIAYLDFLWGTLDRLYGDFGFRFRKFYLHPTTQARLDQAFPDRENEYTGTTSPEERYYDPWHGQPLPDPEPEPPRPYLSAQAAHDIVADAILAYEACHDIHDFFEIDKQVVAQAARHRSIGIHTRTCLRDAYRTCLLRLQHHPMEPSITTLIACFRPRPRKPAPVPTIFWPTGATL